MVETMEQVTAKKKFVSPEDLTALGGAVLYLAFYAAITLFNAHPPKMSPAVWVVLAPLSTFAYLLILVYAIRLLCRQTRSARQETVLMFAFLLFFLILNPTVNQVVQRLLNGENLQHILESLTQADAHPVLGILVPFLLILTGVFFGQLIARLIRERAILVPVTLVSALIDLWGVYWGPVNAMSESAPAAVTGLATAATAAPSVPVTVIQQLSPQLQVVGSILPPDNIGIGDFVFLALFFTCAYRLGLSVTRTMWGIFAGLLLASVVMALDGQTIHGFHIAVSYLPGLLFICGGVLVANLRDWKLTREEWTMTGAIVLILVSLIGASAVHSHFKEGGRRRSAQVQSQTDRKHYTLPLTTDRETIDAALAHLPVTHGAQAVQLIAWFAYANTPGTPQLDGFGILALERNADVAPRKMRELIITAGRSAKEPSWEVVEEVQSPPQRALQFIKHTPGDKREDILQNAQGVPEGALTALAHVNDYAAQAGTTSVVKIVLLPDQIMVVNDKGKPVKKIPYTAVK